MLCALLLARVRIQNHNASVHELHWAVFHVRGGVAVSSCSPESVGRTDEGTNLSLARFLGNSSAALETGSNTTAHSPLVQAYGPVATPTRLDPLVYTVVHYFQHPNISYAMTLPLFCDVLTTLLTGETLWPRSSLRVAAAVCLGRMAKYVPQFSKKFSALVMPVFNDRTADHSQSHSSRPRQY